MYLKDPRLPRVERARAIHLEDETSHLWAVSYADFLMVLLSFFIIFFSLDKKTKDSVIDEIMLYSSGQEGVKGGVAAGWRSTRQARSEPFLKIPLYETNLSWRRPDF